MKKIITLIAALAMAFVMCFSFAGCGSSSDSGDSASSGDKVVIHFASSQGTTHAWYKKAEKFKTKVEEDSNGSIEVQLDFGGVWGTDKDTAEGVQSGSIDMYIGSTVGADAVVTDIGFVNLPYLVTDFDAADELIYNGWMGETITADMEAAGYKMLGMTDCDFRWISNSKHAIESAADISGMKMRVPESPMFIKFFENLGAIPTSMAFTELPSALQQGTVDGQDNGPILSYANGIQEFNKYWVKSNHSFASAVVVMNQGRWESLTEEQQAIIQEAATIYCDDVKSAIRADVESTAKAMEDEGCEVIEPSETLQAEMLKAAKAVWADDEATSTFDQDAVKKIREDAGL